MHVGPTGGAAESLAAVQQSQAQSAAQPQQTAAAGSGVENTVPAATQSSGNNVNTTA